MTLANQTYFITARIRRMGEGNIFTLCVSPHLDGGGGVPHPRSAWGGVSHPRSGWGYPIPGLDGGGYPPWPGLDGITPSPQPGLDGVVSHPRSGRGDTHPRSGWWRYPQDWMGYPPLARTGWGHPPPMTGWGTPSPH